MSQQIFFQNQGINSISHDDSVVVREYYYLESEITDTTGLGSELRKFLDSFKYPLYKEVKVPNDAIIMNVTTGGKKVSRIHFSNKSTNVLEKKLRYI